MEDEKRFKETTDFFVKEMRKVFLDHIRVQKTKVDQSCSAQSFIWACVEELVHTTAILEKDFPENERLLSKALAKSLTQGLSYDVQNELIQLQEKETKNDLSTLDSTHH